MKARDELLHSFSGRLLVRQKLPEDLCLSAFKLGAGDSVVNSPESLSEGPKLAEVFRAMLTHREMQPDSELIQRTGGQVCVAGDESYDFGAAIHELPLPNASLLEALAKTISGAEQQYT